MDEIAEISLTMQVKLLRALQEGEIRRVGSTSNRKVNARIITATNRHLENEIQAGNFREDLYYRLSVFTLRVPSLRERKSDISLLVERFLKNISEKINRQNLRLSNETLQLLMAYNWRGNVRELESVIEYAALRMRGQEILPDDLPAKLQTKDLDKNGANSRLSTLYGDLPNFDELEKRYLLHILEITKGNRTHTAEILGINRRTLYRMATRFKISLDDEFPI